MHKKRMQYSKKHTGNCELNYTKNSAVLINLSVSLITGGNLLFINIFNVFIIGILLLWHKWKNI